MFILVTKNTSGIFEVDILEEKEFVLDVEREQKEVGAETVKILEYPFQESDKNSSIALSNLMLVEGMIDEFQILLAKLLNP